MAIYHKILMHSNGICGILAIFTGLYYDYNFLIFLGLFSMFCVYISWLHIKVLKNQALSTPQKNTKKSGKKG